MYLQQCKVNTINTKNRNRMTHPCHFETVILKELFSFINLTFVTRKSENKSAPIELVIRSEIFYFLTLS